ncbi:MAG: helix-turn-helix domain-containing protein [Acidobacteria bacterium]|nr:helix-turn-helix domain-containing protein [Acidobacteriota bacterium]
MAPDERWVGVEDVAAHLGVAKDSVYRWVEAKRLPARRVGRLLRFRLSDVDHWVESGGGEGAAESDSQRGTKARSPKKRGAR